MEKTKLTKSPLRLYRSARYSILLLIALTVVNVLLKRIRDHFYFASSVYLSYYLCDCFAGWKGILLAALVLVPYLLAFFLSRKRTAWMIIALILFALDTLFLLYIMTTAFQRGENAAVMIADLFVHLLGIVELAMGVKYRYAASEETQQFGREFGPVVTSTDIDDRYTEVACIVSLSKENGKATPEVHGVARFCENELAVGTSSLAKTLLVGAAFTASEEKIRIPYSDIVRAYPSHLGKGIRIELNDGRFVCFTFRNTIGKFKNTAGDSMTELFRTHGVAV